MNQGMQVLYLSVKQNIFLLLSYSPKIARVYLWTKVPLYTQIFSSE